MAISASAVWEVRTTGSDTNGGGYHHTTGTDWSQQDAPQYSVTDGVTNGTTTVTSASANFGTDVVGNVMYIQGGTGSVAANRYQITSRTNSTTVVVDRSTGLTAGTGVTLKIGGAIASPALATAHAVGGNTIHIKSGTYSITSASTNVASGCLAPAAGSGINQVTRILGYGTTRNDYGTPPVLQASGISTFTLLTVLVHTRVVNITFDGNSRTSSRGVNATGTGTIVYLCTATNCTNSGFTGASAANIFIACTATGCSTNPAFTSTTAIACYGCVAASNTVTGFNNLTNGAYNVASNNSGASSVGFAYGSTSLLSNCTAYNNGSHGFSQGNTTGSVLVNCLSVSNGGYAFYSSSATGSATFLNWATYNNTSGVNSPNLTANCLYVNSVTLTADPFTDAAGGDFSLNTVAGGGAACRAAGFPGTFPAVSTTGYLDIGAAQSRTIPAGARTRAIGTGVLVA